jgi:hypothetical protein
MFLIVIFTIGSFVSRERLIVFSRGAEPDIPSMEGRDQRHESGGVSTGIDR